MIEVTNFPIEDVFIEFCQDFKKKPEFDYKGFIHHFKNISNQLNEKFQPSNFFGRGFVDKLHGKVFHEPGLGVVFTLENAKCLRSRTKQYLVRLVLCDNKDTLLQIKIKGATGWTSFKTSPSRLPDLIDSIYD